MEAISLLKTRLLNFMERMITGCAMGPGNSPWSAIQKFIKSEAGHCFEVVDHITAKLVLTGMPGGVIQRSVNEHRDPQSFFLQCCGIFAEETHQIKFGGIGRSAFNYDANFFECRNCGSCFFLGLDEGQIENFYSTNEAGYIGHPQFDSDDVLNKKYSIYKNFTELLSNTKPNSLCDIGCGGGAF